MAKPKIFVDPFQAVSSAALNERKTAKAPKVRRITHAELTNLANNLLNREVTLNAAASMELTARHPHDAAGFIDAYEPGRWDCESNLVYMDVIRTGPSAGMWDGTVVYGRFQAPSKGIYIVVVHFSGYQITMNLNGPWGTLSAYCATTADSAAASAVWNGGARETLFFTMNCTGSIIGYLESIQVFAVG